MEEISTVNEFGVWMMTATFAGAGLLLFYLLLFLFLYLMGQRKLKIPKAANDNSLQEILDEEIDNALARMM